ncbi:MAG: type IV secretion system protein [Parcubacteria group bacterium]|nr:type IV secretion system protein [Parcubacteria group bacterium]MCR4342736.1 type IV secretion system protein [Patescibacteria group bacterium]
MSIKVKIRKFLPLALVLVFFAVVFFSPLGAYNAEAANPITSPGEWIGGKLMELLVNIANIIMWMASLVVWVAGLFFDLTLKISIIDFHSYANMAGITTGWTIARDTINIFFIFILLYIAIATILQIAGYGIKDLLVKVIIIALLVNFSGVVTKVVIDASNVVAVEFYSKITAEAGISSVLMQGLKLQTVYKSYDKPDIAADPTALGVPGGEQMSMGGVIIGALGGTLLMLVTSFVLFAAGILFSIRTITLLFLIILAPLAFAGMILPATSSHSKKWWSTLFSQSFFAPAYMFMIYIVVKMISENNLATAIGMKEGAGVMDFMFKGSINTLVYFIILIGLMIGSLIVASKMGAVGSSTMMKWGTTARKWGQGKAGKIALSSARRATGGIAENIATGKGKISQTLNKIPGVAYGSASIVAANRAKIQEIQKKYEKFTDKELKEMTPRLMPFNRTAVLNELAKRGNLKVEDKDEKGDKKDTNFTQERIEQGKKIMNKYGMSTKEVNKVRPDLATTGNMDEKYKEVDEGVVKSIKAIKPADLEKMDDSVVEKIFTDEKMKVVALENLSMAHLENINKKVRDKIFGNKENIDLMIKNFSAADVKKLADMGGDVADAFFEQIAGLSDTKDINEIIEKLSDKKGINNKSIAAWLTSGPAAKSIMKEYGAKEELEDKSQTIGDKIDKNKEEYEG